MPISHVARGARPQYTAKCEKRRGEEKKRRRRRRRRRREEEKKKRGKKEKKEEEESIFFFSVGTARAGALTIFVVQRPI